MVINVQIQGLKELQRKLKAVNDMMRSMKPYWKSVGEYVQRQTIKERFEKEQSPDGQKWKPHSEMTKKMRAKRHKTGDMRILKDTGELRHVLAKPVAIEAGNSYVIFGTKLKYARIHQFGGIINVSKEQRGYLHHRGFHVGKTIKIPARPFLGITQQEREHIKSMLKSFIKRHITGGG